MAWDSVADAISVVLLLAGAFLALVAAIGVLRFPELLTRMHAATKPQALGLLLIVIGLGFRLRSPGDIGMLTLVALFQLTTSPVASHMVGRTAFRKVPVRRDLLLVDELSPRLDSEDSEQQD